MHAQNNLAHGDFIDAGANTGFHTRQLGLLLNDDSNRRVIAIEPNESLIKTIQKNCQAEMLSNFLIENRALHKETLDNAYFFKNNTDHQISQLVEPSLPNFKCFDDIGNDKFIFNKYAYELITLPTITLADLISKHNLNPTFIKLDVEGSEYEIIISSKNIFKKYRPCISIEIAPWTVPPSKMQYLYQYMKSIQYSWYHFSGIKYSEDVFCDDKFVWHYNSYLILNEFQDVISLYNKMSIELISRHFRFDLNLHESMQKLRMNANR